MSKSLVSIVSVCIIEKEKGKTKALTEEGERGREREKEKRVPYMQLLTNSVGQKR